MKTIYLIFLVLLFGGFMWFTVTIAIITNDYFKYVNSQKELYQHIEESLHEKANSFISSCGRYYYVGYNNYEHPTKKHFVRFKEKKIELTHEDLGELEDLATPTKSKSCQIFGYWEVKDIEVYQDGKWKLIKNRDIIMPFKIETDKPTITETVIFNDIDFLRGDVGVNLVGIYAHMLKPTVSYSIANIEFEQLLRWYCYDYISKATHRGISTNDYSCSEIPK